MRSSARSHGVEVWSKFQRIIAPQIFARRHIKRLWEVLEVIGFRTRLPQKWDSGVGIPPKREKLIVGFSRLSLTTSQGICAGSLQERKRAERGVQHHAALIYQFLEFIAGFHTIARSQISLTPDKCWEERADAETIRDRRIERLGCGDQTDRIRAFTLPQLDLGADHGEPKILDEGSMRILLVQRTAQG
jgi:hypothetical protein